MADIIDIATSWASQGVPVFPCGSNKAPLTLHGHKDASTDINKVREMFQAHGGHAVHVGGAMGRESGLFALDFDLYKGDEPKQFMQELINSGLLPETRVHETQSGGLHVIYESEAGWPNCKPCAGVEVKGEGGYIILSGTAGYTVKQEGLTAAPKRLIEFLTKAKRENQTASDAILKQNILDAEDFHDSLTVLSARMAKRGFDQVRIQKELLEVMDASVAANPRHPRYPRWDSIMRGSDKELSRIIKSGYSKYNPVSASEVMLDGIDASKLEAAKAFGFAPSPSDRGFPEVEPETVEVFDSETNPFEGMGRYAHEEKNLLSVKFNLYPIFAEGETVVIFAEPKTGKTALALTTALHIACGYDFGTFRVAEAGPTLYYGLEGQSAIHKRIDSWIRHRKDEGSEVPDEIPLFTVEKSTNFYRDESRQTEANRVIAYNKYCVNKYGTPLKVLVIDTLTKAMSGGDQNDAGDTSKLFEFIGLCRDGGVTATIIFVHHKSRQGNARGSTNIEAEPDVLLDVSKEGDTISMKVAKARSIEDGATFRFTIHGYDLGTNEQGFQVTGMYISPIEGESVDEASAAMQVSRTVAGQLQHIADMGIGEHKAVDVLERLDKYGLLPKLGRRRPISPVNIKSPITQKFLHELIGAGGEAFGSTVIYRVETSGEVTALSVRPIG